MRFFFYFSKFKKYFRGTNLYSDEKIQNEVKRRLTTQVENSYFNSVIKLVKRSIKMY